MSIFPVRLSLRLDWSEMDMFGHINNVSYFKYIQASRVNYWERIGINSDFKSASAGPLLLSTGCRFIKPLVYPGNITVQASVTYIKNTSFGIKHQLLNDDGELAAEAEDVIVMYDYTKNEKIPVPADIRKLIEELEQKTF